MYRIAKEQSLYSKGSYGYKVNICLSEEDFCDMCGEELAYKPMVSVQFYPDRSCMDSEVILCKESVGNFINILSGDVENDSVDFSLGPIEAEEVIHSLQKAEDIISENGILKVLDGVSVMKRVPYIVDDNYSFNSCECRLNLSKNSHECGDHLVVINSSYAICRCIIEDVVISSSPGEHDSSDDWKVLVPPDWEFPQVRKSYKKACENLDKIDSAIMSNEI